MERTVSYIYYSIQLEDAYFITLVKNKKPKKEKSKEPTVQPVPEEELKPSWASIAKGPIKPEEIVVVPVAIEEEKVAMDSVVDEVAVDEVTVEEAVTNEDAAEQVVIVDEQVSKEESICEQVITTEPVKEDTTQDTTQEETAMQESIPEEDPIKEEEAKIDSNKEKNEEPIDPAQAHPTTVKRKSTAIRRLNQVEAVVLPGNQQEAAASLSSVNVQFGSLNLNQTSDSEIEDEVKETVIQQKEEPVIKEVVAPKEPVIQQTVKEPVQPQVVVQAPTVQPQVVPPPVQPILQESYTPTSYSTFVPNTMSAYHHGIIAPTTTAEYAVYNPEQRMVSTNDE
jgi:ribosomal protein L25 (general stress protein Ctc)